MTITRIAVVLGDIGSARELLPAAKLLMSKGFDVQFFVDPKGKASDVLSKERIAYESRVPSLDDPFQLVLVGTSVTAYGLQLEWMGWGHAKTIPVLLYEDLWTSANRPHLLEVDPSLMLVIDNAAADITARARPHMRPEDIRVVGKPTFEDLPGIAAQAPEIRRRTREALGVGEHDLLLVHWSSGEVPAEVQRQITLYRDLVLDSTFGGRLFFAPRLHPKLGEPTLTQLWQLATTGKVQTVDARGIKVAEHLSLAADVVSAAWTGTEGYRAMLLLQPVIVPFFPEEQERRIQAGHPDGLTPIVRYGAATGVSCSAAALAVLLLVGNRSEGFLDDQRRARAPFLPLLEPGAAERIAALVESQLA